MKKTLVIIFENANKTLNKKNLETLNIKFFLFVTVCKKLNFFVNLIVKNTFTSF